MTRLDRLEALAEKWQKRGLMARETKIALDALPGLIRAARAAKNTIEELGYMSAELDEALAPLFAEAAE